MADETLKTDPKKGVRWWPAALVLLLAGGTILWMRLQRDKSFQEKNLGSLEAVIIAFLLLLLWWLILSRTGWRLRLWVAALVVGGLGLTASLFHIRGVSGDLLPILEPRWAGHSLGQPSKTSIPPVPPVASGDANDFPQFLGPHRTGQLDSPTLNPDWKANPPQVLWRQPIGPGWSGWVVVGARALTQEQRGEEESCTCYEVLTGHLLWSHGDAAHYNTTIAGEGPRCTPTVVSNRVFT